MLKISSLGGVILILEWFVITPLPAAATETRAITFPVLGPVSYSNDFGAPRSGHTHEGNDLMGTKGQVLLAAVDGTIRQVAYPEPSYGWYISLTDKDGYEYIYIHINNDTPGTDDNKGGAIHAYMFGTSSGWPVRAGQAIAYMGDSGNAESTRPHLHFEIRTPNGEAINPFTSLQAAKKTKIPKSRARRTNEVVPFPGTTVGLRLASGQLDPATPEDELVVAPSSGAAPVVRVFRGPVSRLKEFTVREAKGKGGVDVAVGDTNGDGVDEIIVGFGRGSEPYVQVFTLDGLVLASFPVYPIRFRGGVNVATADLDGDGRDEIITGAGPGGGPDIRVYDFSGQFITSFLAYELTFRGGVDVAAQAATETSEGQIVTSPGPGRTTEVRVFSRLGTLVVSWNGYTAETTTGARLTVWPSNGFTADSIVIIPAGKSTSLARRFGFDSQLWDEQRAFERWWFGDFDVGMWRGEAVAGTGNSRPTSIVPTSLGSRSFWWDFDN